MESDFYHVWIFVRAFVFQLKLLYFYIIIIGGGGSSSSSMDILPACISMHYIQFPRRPEESVRAPLGLEIQAVVSCQVGTENRAWVPGRAASAWLVLSHLSIHCLKIKICKTVRWSLLCRPSGVNENIPAFFTLCVCVAATVILLMYK